MLLRTIGIWSLVIFAVLLSFAILAAKVMFIVWCIKFAIGVVA